MIAVIYGGITLILSFLSTCMPYSKVVLGVIGASYFATCFCEGLKLLILSADVCTTDIGDPPLDWGPCELNSGAGNGYSRFDVMVCFRKHGMHRYASMSATAVCMLLG